MAAPKLLLLATGSEVHLALEARTRLEAEGVPTRVVSMPSWELFAEQDDAYQVSVMGIDVPRVSVEAGSTFGWSLWADACVGIDHFGESARLVQAADQTDARRVNDLDFRYFLEL